MTLEDLLTERHDPRMSIVTCPENDDRFGSESSGRYLSIDGHLWPEPEPWRETGAPRELVEAFVDNALVMVLAHDQAACETCAHASLV